MTEASTESRAPALFGHCETVYNAMLARATSVREGNVRMVVWEGFLTKLILEELRLATPYYTSVTQALTKMGCIRQLRRGGSSTTSQWELLRAPNLATFHEVNIREPTAQ